MTEISPQTYPSLVNNISRLLAEGRKTAIQKVNHILVETYWHVGKYIVEFEQSGLQKADYGSTLLLRLSKDLNQQFGKGFSRSNLQWMRLFFITYPKYQTLSGKLSWSHYVELLSVSDDLARSFYEQQCIIEGWSVRELQRQRNSALFERLALSKNKEEVLELANKGQEAVSPQNIVKDPYIFEFLDFSNKEVILEKDLENELTDKLGHFLLELGKGFAFIGKQYRITVDNQHFYVDLVFYHRILKCFVLLDLKTGKASHQDVGQMNLYLNYFKIEENVDGDNPPIGIVLAADKNDILVEYATAGIENHLFVSKYQLYLPNKAELKNELVKLLDEQQEAGE